MKYRILILLFTITACGGKLSDEQRKKMIENMELNKLKKVPDAEITETSYEYGRTIFQVLESHDKTFSRPALIDSLQKVYQVKIQTMTASDSLLHSVEKQLIEAYTSGAASGAISDNVQKLGSDSILYTKPIMKDLPDGSIEFVKAIGIRISKKTIVLSIKN